MISIKKSIADCSRCPLLQCPSCILETNCKSDLSKVEILFLAENPGKDEVEREVPLIGRAGQTFRKFFKKYNLNKMKYLLSNVVLCQTLNPDGTTGNPTKEVIDLCKVNCMELIKQCNPKLVVLMGSSAMNAFGIEGVVSDKRGKFYKWNEYNLMVTFHPSYVMRKQSDIPKFEEDIKKAAEFMTGEHIGNERTTSKEKSIGSGIFRYTIPEHFYTNEYRLVDVQYLKKTKEVLYIFRDKENKKVYHKEDDKYVYYRAKEGAPLKKTMPYEVLEQVVIPNEARGMLDHEKCYEGDVKLTVKHAMDYYHFNKGDPENFNMNIMFFDIEVDTGDQTIFPEPEKADFPINMFTSIYHGKKTHYVVDNKTEPIVKIEGVEYKIFDNEKKMIEQFLKDFKETDIDILSGWNLISFDLNYIFNRAPKIGIRRESFSNFFEFYVDAKRWYAHLPGCICIDQDFLYRTFTFTKMENYKLSFIAEHELGVTKISLPLPFNQMYWKMLNKTIEYNIRDSELLEMLENKLSHIKLFNELRVICNTSFEAMGSFGEIDSLTITFLRNRGIASRDAYGIDRDKEKYKGAFVFEAQPAIYDYVTDFDFASLYPSIIITYNIGINTFVMKTKDPSLGYEMTYHPENLPEKVPIIIDPLGSAAEMLVPREDLIKKVKDENLIFTINGCFFKNHKKELSYFAEIVEMVMNSRKEYKNKMFEAIVAKNKTLESFYYTRQLVYKVLANTLYGVIANKAFRFFDLSLASGITLSGQEALKTCIINGDSLLKSMVEKTEIANPLELTKKEMFSDEMPNRNNRYVITGDTDSIFCCFNEMKEEKSVKNIKTWCDRVENYLNEGIIVDLIKKHMVHTDFNRLKLKNEMIISRGLFLTKKRYIIRVISQEGKDVDKTIYMGVEIKRSDYPRKSKEFLAELADLILKGNEKLSPVKLLSYIKNKEKEFRHLIMNGDKSIARPVSFGKELEDYKTVPQGVRAMEAWNNIVYDIHKTGSKAYMFFVSGIDREKAPREVLERYEKFVGHGGDLKVIAVPDEESRLPSYFIPDLKYSLKFTFTDRYELMLKPLFATKEDIAVMRI